MLLEQVIVEIEQDHPSWNWLVRTDATEGYFANIYNSGSTVVHPSYASTAVGALQGSLDLLKEYLVDVSRPRRPAKNMFTGL